MSYCIVDLNRSYSNVMGMTLLHIACLSQNLDVVLYLCGKGVSFKAKDIYGKYVHISVT